MSKYTIVDKECYGCSTKLECSLLTEQRRGCPCKECLIKVTCKAACEDYVHNRYLFG